MVKLRSLGGPTCPRSYERRQPISGLGWEGAACCCSLSESRQHQLMAGGQYNSTTIIQLPATDPPVCPLHTSSPILQRPAYSGPGGHRLPGQTEAAAAGWRDASLVAGVFGLARATSTYPRTTVTPYPTSRSPDMVRTGQKGFIPTTTTTTTTTTSGRSFSSCTRLIPIPETLCNSGLVDVVHRV